KVAVGARGGLESQLLEPLGDELGRPFDARGAGRAALLIVMGQEGDVVPQPLFGGTDVGGGGRRTRRRVGGAHRSLRSGVARPESKSQADDRRETKSEPKPA